MITPRVISLDLDDTLWAMGSVIATAERDLLAWMREHHPRVSAGHDVESMRAIRASVVKRFPEQSHDMTFLRRRALFEQFAAAGESSHAVAGGSTAALDSSVEAALEIFLAGRNRVTLYPDVRPALTRLRSKYRLFALSNGNAELRRCGIDDLFEGHITAAAVGAGKPDARMFSRLLRDTGVEAIEVMHIGDDPLADVVGATQAGMQAVWINRDAQAWPQHFATPLRTIKTLAEIS